MCRRQLVAGTVVVALVGLSPHAARAQELDDLVLVEEQPAERPPGPAQDDFPAPVDLKEALDLATEAVRAAEQRGPDIQDKLREAEFYVQHARLFDRVNLRADFINARMNILIGRPRDAYTQVSRYVRTSPEGASDWEAFRVLGDLLLQGRYYVQAEAKYKQALELNPNEVSIYLGLAQCSSSRARRLEAVEYAHTAVQLDSTSPEAHDVYASALMAQGALEEAREAVRTSIALTQTALRDSPSDTALLRKLYTRYGLLQTILEYLTPQAAGPGNDPNVHADRTLEYVEIVLARAEIARLLAIHRLWTRLQNTIDSAESGSPPKLVYEFAELSMVLERYDRAVKLLEDLLAADPTEARARELLEELRAAAAASPPGGPAEP